MGKKSVIEGLKYEKTIHSILSKCYILNILFNTQCVNELGGCTNRPDIICNYKGPYDVAIEVKKSKSPEFMQCKLNYIDNKWVPSEKANVNFIDLIKDIELFNGNVPPFIKNKLTFEEWSYIKNNCNNFDDTYMPISNDTIQKLYLSKGYKYIQIHEKGLYHLGDDYCNFNVPKLIGDQKLRIRIKNHGTQDINGLCKLSVTAACYFANMKQLPYSKYSLDDIEKLPPSLRYDN